MSTSKRARWSSTWRSWTPGSRARSPGACSVSTLIERAGQVAQLGQRPGLDRPARADDRHPVAQGLDLGEDVAREQHRPPVLARLLDAGLEDGLLERVEPRGRLVEHEQLGVGGERGDERHLLAVALRVRAALLGRVELEALEQLRPPLRVEPAAERAEQVDRLAAGERRPQVHVTGHVGEPAVQRDGVVPRVAAEQPGVARVRRAAGRAGRGWSSTCPRRSVPGSHAPRPSRPAARGRRAPGSRRRS